jgi:hypothetical protein
LQDASYLSKIHLPHVSNPVRVYFPDWLTFFLENAIFVLKRLLIVQINLRLPEVAFTPLQLARLLDPFAKLRKAAHYTEILTKLCFTLNAEAGFKLLFAINILLCLSNLKLW